MNEGKNKRVFNFSPGPAVLPDYVLKHAAEDIYNFRGSGIGILELSHRSKQFDTVMSETEELMRSILNIPKNYKVLFITGGGTAQFSMIPMNLVRQGEIANYIVSGFWGERAESEAKRVSPTHIAASSKDIAYKQVPKTFSLSERAAYLHYTTNDTIEGVAATSIPNVPKEIPLIGDASSDFLSRPLDVSKYGMIYAAAQKNAGTSGVTIIIIREDLLERSPNTLPSMLSYRVFAENGSMFNTPPTFSIYITMRTLEWIRDEGGLQKMEERAKQRAKLLYDAIDRSEFYVGLASPEYRSLMNITFRLKDESQTAEFIKQAETRKIYTIGGYRTVGGIRVSLYNAAPLEGVQELVNFMNEFATKH